MALKSELALVAEERESGLRDSVVDHRPPQALPKDETVTPGLGRDNPVTILATWS